MLGYVLSFLLLASTPSNHTPAGPAPVSKPAPAPAPVPQDNPLLTCAGRLETLKGFIAARFDAAVKTGVFIQYKLLMETIWCDPDGEKASTIKITSWVKQKTEDGKILCDVSTSTAKVDAVTAIVIKSSDPAVVDCKTVFK